MKTKKETLAEKVADRVRKPKKEEDSAAEEEEVEGDLSRFQLAKGNKGRKRTRERRTRERHERRHNH